MCQKLKEKSNICPAVVTSLLEGLVKKQVLIDFHFSDLNLISLGAVAVSYKRTVYDTMTGWIPHTVCLQVDHAE